VSSTLGAVGRRDSGSGVRLVTTWAPPSTPPVALAPEVAGERVATAAGESFRPDIEGLRAIAVLLVLAYHAQLGPFHGGYVGVDVFFVLSGFLITSLLLRELRSSGTISLARFWSRRARRLLAASCLVIVVTLLAGHVVLDPLAQIDLGREALAASTFVINILFAVRQSDYLTADLAPSPLLHYWSLAVEEQFYLLWPVLVLLVVGRRRHPMRVAAVVIGALWAASFLGCLWLTSTSQPWAFFSLPTRAWELLTGAALAVGISFCDRIPAVVRAALGWIGVAAIVAVGITYSATTTFPGPAAILPVLATAAVVAAGATTVLGPAGLLSLRPLQWIGRHSYSIYLWHWPALVLVGVQFGPLSAWERAGVVLGSILVAAVAQHFLEDPVRHSKWLAAKAWRGLTLGAGFIGIGIAASLVAVAAAPGLIGSGAAAAPVTLAAPTTALPATTVAPTTVATARRPGVTTTVAPTTTTTPPPTPEQLAQANAGLLTASVGIDAVPSNLRPSLGAVRGDVPKIYSDGCHLDASATSPGPCEFGDTTSATTIVLFGDSHAAQWFPAFDQLAAQHHWRLLVLTKKGCPTAEIPVFSPMVNRELRECGPWRTNVIARLASEHPDVVVLSSYRYRTTGPVASPDPDEAWRAGLTTTMAALRPTAEQVVILGDTPTPADDVPSCVSSHLRRATACVNSRADAVKDKRLAVEREVAAAHDARFVPTSDWLCTPDRCPVILGDLLLYRDANHLTATATTWLAPYIEAMLTGALAAEQASATTTTAVPATAPAATAPTTAATAPTTARSAATTVGDPTTTRPGRTTASRITPTTRP
jgi:peptidoglycan/LPS O-acetylase OafA/YrhL